MKIPPHLKRDATLPCEIEVVKICTVRSHPQSQVTHASTGYYGIITKYARLFLFLFL